MGVGLCEERLYSWHMEGVGHDGDGRVDVAMSQGALVLEIGSGRPKKVRGFRGKSLLDSGDF